MDLFLASTRNRKWLRNNKNQGAFNPKKAKGVNLISPVVFPKMDLVKRG